MNDIHEEFRVIPGWPEYEISNLGAIRRLTPRRGTRVGRPLKLVTDPFGYKRVRLYGAENAATLLVHRLVAFAFIDANGVGSVCHGDGNPSNNSVSNLRFDSQLENMRDAVAMGRMRRGERHGMNKHSREIILMVRDRMACGARPSAVAREFGMTESHVRKIHKRRVWSWL